MVGRFKMLITTDDLCPKFMDFFREYWDPLKARHPDLKLIAFTVLDWRHKVSKKKLGTTIPKKFPKEFIEFCNKRKKWLVLAPHALTHQYAEGTDPKLHDIIRIIRNAMEKTECKILSGYKPPFYRFNAQTPFTVKSAGLRFFFTPGGIMDLGSCTYLKRETINLIDSHTNPDLKANLQDRIDLIFDKLDAYLKLTSLSHFNKDEVYM